MPTLTVSAAVAINYEVEGLVDAGAPTLVFVHGWCSSLRTWDPQVAAFARDHRIVRLDRRGHGASSAPPSGYSTDDHAGDLAALLDAEGVRDAVLVAHAGGAPAALTVSLARPEVVRGAVLIGVGWHRRPTVSEGGDDLGRMFFRLVQRLQACADDHAVTSVYRGFFGPHASAEAVAEACRVASSTPRHVAVECIVRDVCGVDMIDLAQRMTQPILCVRGEHDGLRAAPSEAAPCGVVTAPIAGARHFPHVEQPHQVNAAIRRFVGTATGAAPGVRSRRPSEGGDSGIGRV